MLIEIHMIQNHCPANMNRDDLGAPKTCIFGGVTRARISSQCLKRSIRRSPEFAVALEKDGGVQTRSLIREVARQASTNGVPDENTVMRLEKIFKEGGVPIEGKKGDETATKIIWVLPRSAIKSMAAAITQTNGNLTETIAGILGDSAIVPDIALAGRMTEFDAKGPFENLTKKLRVEAALSTAHAISTHAVINEVDYFTAAEDLTYTQGAAHPDEAMYSSACFYKYFCLDWDQMVKNLAGPEPDKEKDEQAYQAWKNEIEPQAKKLAACTLGHFIRTAAKTTPSGKQNSFASHTEPCGILVEIKKNGKHPTNYANAFADPIERIGKWEDDGPDYVSLEGRSIARLGDHIFNLRQAYGTNSTLFWYAMPLYRFPLQGWEREADGRKAKVKNDKGEPTKEDKPPVPLTEKCFCVLGGNGSEDAGLIEAVVNDLDLGFKWADVRDAGRIKPGMPVEATT